MKKKIKPRSKVKAKAKKESSPMMKFNAVVVFLAFLVYAYIVFND